MQIADMSFGLSSQALALGQILSQKEIDFEGHINTFPFYNGRERLLCLRITKTYLSMDSLYIIFGDNRNSDDLIIQHWKGPNEMNPPTIADIPEDCYPMNKKFILWGRLDEAIKYIEKLIMEYKAEK